MIYCVSYYEIISARKLAYWRTPKEVAVISLKLFQFEVEKSQYLGRISWSDSEHIWYTVYHIRYVTYPELFLEEHNPGISLNHDAVF